MGDLIDLKVSNGECIADYGDVVAKLRLHCVEELGDEYARNKNYTSIWIPINNKKFWTVIKTICDKNANNRNTQAIAKRKFELISKYIDELMRYLEE